MSSKMPSVLWWLHWYVSCFLGEWQPGGIPHLFGYYIPLPPHRQHLMGFSWRQQQPWDEFPYKNYMLILTHFLLLLSAARCSVHVAWQLNVEARLSQDALLTDCVQLYVQLRQIDRFIQRLFAAVQSEPVTAVHLPDGFCARFVWQVCSECFSVCDDLRHFWQRRFVVELMMFWCAVSLWRRPDQSWARSCCC